MMASLRPACLFVVVNLLSGCATTWVKLEESRVTDPEKTFTLHMPVGWVRAPTLRNDVLVTRDGVGVQFIKVSKRTHKNAFPRIKKESKPDMLPNELAELILAEIKSSQEMSAVEVISNQPTGIGQKVGVRLHLQMKNKEGLRYQTVVCALVDKGGVYEITYRAPVLHYFKRDLPAFEGAVQSFRLTEKKT